MNICDDCLYNIGKCEINKKHENISIFSCKYNINKNTGKMNDLKNYRNTATFSLNDIAARRDKKK